METRMSKRLTKDLEAIQKNYKDTFTVELPNGDLKFWHVSFSGAPATIYASEKFKFINNFPRLINLLTRLQFKFTTEYVL